MENGSTPRLGPGKRRAGGSGGHRAGARGPGRGAGRHRAEGSFPLPEIPERIRKPQFLVAAAAGLVLAGGAIIGSEALLGGEDSGGGGGGQEDDAALLYSNGVAVDDDFTERHSGLVEQIHTELEIRYGIAPDELYNAESNADGPRVVLTLDEQLQETAEDAGSEAGVVAIEPGTGAVLCYFGAEEETGADQVGDDTPHPPSSVFDMVTAAAALENGATTDSEWPYGPDDEVTLETAVRESRKEAVDEIASEYGSETVVETAAALGVSDLGDQDGTVHDLESGEVDYDAFAADGFGTYPVSVSDMAAVYATIAGDGVHADTHFVDRVVDGAGDSIEADQGIRTSQAISPDTAGALQEMGLGNGDAIEERDYFGFSGTWYEEPPQSWYVGAIPQLSVAAWIGDAEGADDVDTAGVPVWRAVVDAAIDSRDFAPETWDGGGDEPSSEDPTSAEEPSESPSEAPSSEEPSSEDPTTETSEPPDDPTTSEEPEDPTSDEPSEDPTDDCGWICW
ncbi:penicillin-binding transpeptidase domain-containing protein [Glycomyces salinus]|uniref:penicillin-binding transpeptidase domain-containing protein n=1 Tax=Glycomyces salinus TaxID=980294 RepID=UPI0018ECE1D8|nr:penicillin-binding transpeptidase domain-containing protein [Glycomyces salinus]